MSYETDIHTWLRAAAGAGGRGGRSLKQDTVGFLFCLLLFHGRFPIYLSDQVIEDLRGQQREKRGIQRRQASLLWHMSPPIKMTKVREWGGGEAWHLGALTSRTLIFDLAEDSKKAQWFHCLARFWPCSFPTTRSSSKSHLFPTRIIGTWGGGERVNTVAAFIKLQT